ncbi:MAG: NotI family restriction endonuclease [Thermodesulfobacteriota bacterium]
MKKEQQPLAEVFGHLVTDRSDRAARYRKRKICPFNNKVPNCTKDKAKNPLGVCSIYHGGNPVITCPIRFREEWLITDDAADFFFEENAGWTSITEVRLNDHYGKSAGNIDVVLVAYDKNGKVYDFGALEIQAVYISGNVREPFEHYLSKPDKNSQMDWSNHPSYPRPDYLSSSRKRLAPQLLFKGGILNAWGKKIAVAINKGFFDTLPSLERVERDSAEIIWLIYDLAPQLNRHNSMERYKLTKIETVYTRFQPALKMLTRPKPGNVNAFMKLLQEKVDEKLESPPVNKTIDNPFE